MKRRFCGPQSEAFQATDYDKDKTSEDSEGGKETIQEVAENSAEKPACGTGAGRTGAPRRSKLENAIETGQ